MLTMARKLSNEWKFTARTCRELHEEAARALIDHGSIKFRGRKIGMEALINAAMLYLLDVPRDQREALLTSYVRRFELMLDGEGEADSPGREDESRSHGRPMGGSSWPRS